MEFTPTRLSKAEEELRAEVRQFLAEELPPGSYRPGLGMSSGHSPDFSRKLAARGWLGMALPSAYGGQDRTAVDRFVVVEELLAAGAPVGAHWVADRQTAPAILRFGTEDQRRRFLPAIAAGECYFSIGMSEPDAGSDLAAVRTTATRVDDGWLVNGTKVWTTAAHLNHWFVILCRTGPPGEGAGGRTDRHQGLSQLIVDLSSPGVKVAPIPFLDGSHDFNEVVLNDVFVPDELVLGEPGMGWQQVTSELAYERAGPDRFLSAYQVLETFLRERVAVHTDPDASVLDAFGRLVARMWAIRQLSLSVARAIDRGEAPAVEAAIVKDIGTTFEQEAVEVVRSLVDVEPSLDATSLFEQLLARSVLISPSYTLRGGTNEVLRSVAAKALARR